MLLLKTKELHSEIAQNSFRGAEVGLSEVRDLEAAKAFFESGRAVVA
jgi:hypothetical protein